MKVILYDGTWMGFLSAVFVVYEYKFSDVSIQTSGNAGSLFSEAKNIETDHEKSVRVITKLKQVLTPKAFQQLFKSFLSEEKEIENLLLRYIRYILGSSRSVENNYSNPEVLALQQISRKVHREKHRMEAFVRFELTGDDLFYAVIQPDFNVLPLICKHFKDRYADQRWLIYDSSRKYGIYYDLNTVTEVSIDFKPEDQSEGIPANIYHEEEGLYKMLWQQYFKSVNIAARKNMKLHIQHMPKRYWKYLVEKHAGL